MPPKVKKPTKKAQEFIGKKIGILMREGRPQPQAIAIAYDLARKSGFRSVPRKKTKK